MGRCISCGARPSNTIKTCYFPRNKERRIQWTKCLNKPNWTPSDYSVLCEKHFAPEIWEKTRIDGAKKLKNNAIPTLFEVPDAQTVTISSKRKELDLFLENKGESVEHIADAEEHVNTLESSSYVINEAMNNIAHQPVEIEEQPNVSYVQSSYGNASIEEMAKELQEITKKYESVCNNYQQMKRKQEGLEKISVEKMNLRKSMAVEYNEIKKKYEGLKKMYLLGKKARKRMKLEYRKMKRKLKNRIENLQVESLSSKLTAISKLLNVDQVQFITSGKSRVREWSDKTLTEAYALKFACGNSGYTHLLEKGWPFPSCRTLTRRLEGWKFESEISDEIFEFLKIKADQFEHNVHRDCVLVLDEMSIASGEKYDLSTGGNIGNITLPNHLGLATHALVFMLAGIAHRWKQVIAYYYTGNIVDGSIFAPIIVEIIKRAEKIGLRVHGVISDMGSANQAMWKVFGINVNRYSKINNSSEHPCNCKRRLFFFHDPPHALKNFKEGLFNNNFITIPKSFVQKYDLPSDKVSVEHFLKLISEQETLFFKPAPKLKRELVEKNKHFLKMRVGNAKNVLSHEVSCALHVLADTNNEPELKTTSWFVGVIARWFQFMSNRGNVLALSYVEINKYHDTVSFFER